MCQRVCLRVHTCACVCVLRRFKMSGKFALDVPVFEYVCHCVCMRVHAYARCVLPTKPWMASAWGFPKSKLLVDF